MATDKNVLLCHLFIIRFVFYRSPQRAPKMSTILVAHWSPVVARQERWNHTVYTVVDLHFFCYDMVQNAPTADAENSSFPLWELIRQHGEKTDNPNLINAGMRRLVGWPVPYPAQDWGFLLLSMLQRKFITLTLGYAAVAQVGKLTSVSL